MLDKKPKSNSSKSQPSIYKVTEDCELMKFLLQTFSHKSRNHIKSLLTHKSVYVDGKAVSQYNYLLKPGQEVEIKTGVQKKEERKFSGIEIIYEDKDLIVIYKPEGLLSMATEDEKKETAYSLLSQYVKSLDHKNKIFIVHRLDRETSGVMMFARSSNVQELLQEAWNMNVTERTYLAIVEGAVENDKGTISSYLRESKAFIVYSSEEPVKGSQKAITHYKVLQRTKAYSLVEVTLETGRKNQIRVHMQDIGHPVIGDKKYGSSVNPIKRLGLHAWVLAFTHPITKKELRFETEIPNAFQRIVPVHKS
jgi:23S rRNA pseudouridine1911/1915/1917 synthase